MNYDLIQQIFCLFTPYLLITLTLIHSLNFPMYDAVYQPDPSNPYPKDVIYLPQVSIYWDNWGAEKDDHCLVALEDNK